ncbi:hypothetical protein F4604DRAFT_1930978 [Suillus subluteus]|nr:hypothetical protein F4604DRAFT_1930978 [Suillus subluteus]
MTAASATSDGDDDMFPLTPNSKHSTGECHIADTSVEAGFPTANHSPGPENQHNDPFLSYSRASSSQGAHVLHKIIDNIVCDQGTSQSVEQKDKETYLKQMEQLGANSFHLVICVLEAVRERECMFYFAACWDIAVFERQKDVTAYACETSKANFLMVKQELRSVLDILAQRLLLPCATIVDDRHLVAARDNNMRSIQRADDVLAFVKSHGNPVGEN